MTSITAETFLPNFAQAQQVVIVVSGAEGAKSVIYDCLVG